MKLFKLVATLGPVLVLLSACDGDARPFTEAVELRDLNLQSLEVVPPSNSQSDIFLNIGQALQFDVIGRNGDEGSGSIALSSNDRAWSVSDTSVASINENGYLVARANGTVSVSMNLGGLVSDSFSLSVSDATLSSISSIVGSSTLERCIPSSYYATGIFSDDTVRNLDDVTWSTSNSVQTQLFETTGSATSLNATFADDGLSLTAAVTGVTSFALPITVADNLVSIAIAPARIIVDEGDELDLTAVGTYSRPSTADASLVSQTIITANVEWAVTVGTDNATLNNLRGSKGLLTGVDEGNTSINVHCGDVFSPNSEFVVGEEDTDSSSDSLAFQVNGESVSGSQIVLNLETDSTLVTLRVSTGSDYDADDDISSSVTFEEQYTDATNPPFVVENDGTDDPRIRLIARGTATIRATETTAGEPVELLTVTVE